jgi:hypothetical protein
MLLRRLFNLSGENPKISGIRILRAGPRQHFSQKIIDQGIFEGWLSMGQGRITLISEGGVVIYRIDRAPGYYCCHCQQKLDDGPTGQAHVETTHKKKKSTDPSNPCGYRKDNFYACVKED